MVPCKRKGGLDTLVHMLERLGKPFPLQILSTSPPPMQLPISIGKFQATNYGMFKGKSSERHQILHMRKGQNLMEGLLKPSWALLRVARGCREYLFLALHFTYWGAEVGFRCLSQTPSTLSSETSSLNEPRALLRFRLS